MPDLYLIPTDEELEFSDIVEMLNAMGIDEDYEGLWASDVLDCGFE